MDGRRDARRDGFKRVGFININDMYNNDVGKGVVYAYEAYEANKGWWPLGRLFTS
jgi:hypothetical protein